MPTRRTAHLLLAKPPSCSGRSQPTHQRGHALSDRATADEPRNECRQECDSSGSGAQPPKPCVITSSPKGKRTATSGSGEKQSSAGAEGPPVARWCLLGGRVVPVRSSPEPCRLAWRLACESPWGEERYEHAKTGLPTGMPGWARLVVSCGPRPSSADGTVWAAGRSLPGMSLAFARGQALGCHDAAASPRWLSTTSPTEAAQSAATTSVEQRPTVGCGRHQRSSRPRGRGAALSAYSTASLLGLRIGGREAETGGDTSLRPGKGPAAAAVRTPTNPAMAGKD